MSTHMKKVFKLRDLPYITNEICKSCLTLKQSQGLDKVHGYDSYLIAGENMRHGINTSCKQKYIFQIISYLS